MCSLIAVTDGQRCKNYVATLMKSLGLEKAYTFYPSLTILHVRVPDRQARKTAQVLKRENRILSLNQYRR